MKVKFGRMATGMIIFKAKGNIISSLNVKLNNGNILNATKLNY